MHDCPSWLSSVHRWTRPRHHAKLLCSHALHRYCIHARYSGRISHRLVRSRQFPSKLYYTGRRHGLRRFASKPMAAAAWPLHAHAGERGLSARARPWVRPADLTGQLVNPPSDNVGNVARDTGTLGHPAQRSTRAGRTDRGRSSYGVRDARNLRQERHEARPNVRQTCRNFPFRNERFALNALTHMDLSREYQTENFPFLSAGCRRRGRATTGCRVPCLHAPLPLAGRHAVRAPDRPPMHAFPRTTRVKAWRPAQPIAFFPQIWYRDAVYVWPQDTRGQE